MTAAPLSYPADLWCPCGLHIRCAPGHEGVKPPLCPVCADEPVKVASRSAKYLLRQSKMDAAHLRNAR